MLEKNNLDKKNTDKNVFKFNSSLKFESLHGGKFCVK